MLTIRNFACTLKIRMEPSTVVMNTELRVGVGLGLDLNPVFVVYQLCDIGQVFNHAVPLFLHHKMGDNNSTYTIRWLR